MTFFDDLEKWALKNEEKLEEWVICRICDYVLDEDLESIQDIFRKAKIREEIRVLLKKYKKKDIVKIISKRTNKNAKSI